jgi:hypothetical protein
MAIDALLRTRNWRPSVLSAALALVIAVCVGAFSVLAMHSAATALQYLPPEAIETAAAIDSLL